MIRYTWMYFHHSSFLRPIDISFGGRVLVWWKMWYWITCPPISLTLEKRSITKTKLIIKIIIIPYLWIKYEYILHHETELFLLFLEQETSVYSVFNSTLADIYTHKNLSCMWHKIGENQISYSIIWSHKLWGSIWCYFIFP